jgi:hypothetical protein
MKGNVLDLLQPDIYWRTRSLPILPGPFQLCQLLLRELLHVCRQCLLKLPWIFFVAFLQIRMGRHHHVVHFVRPQLPNHSPQGNLPFQFENRTVFVWLVVFEPSVYRLPFSCEHNPDDTRLEISPAPSSPTLFWLPCLWIRFPAHNSPNPMPGF